MHAKTEKLVLYSIAITAVLHAFLWFNWQKTPIVSEERRPLLIRNIRTVGVDNSAKSGIELKDLQSQKTPAPSRLEKPKQPTELSLHDLAGQTPLNNRFPGPKYTSKTGIKKLDLSSEQVKNIMRENPSQVPAQDLIRSLGENNIDIKFELPKGVKLDELNEFELQFYSFQKRTALNYVNSFYRQLEDYRRQHPHLKFPFTEKQERMTGRVTYDMNGNVVRIKMTQWTDKEKLQSFFLELLQSLNRLPNPPKAVLENGEFTIYYSLNIVQ